MEPQYPFSVLTINSTRRIICYNQTIYDDMRLEVSEYFGLRLHVDYRTTFATEIRPMYGRVTIEIQDDDSDSKQYIYTTFSAPWQVSLQNNRQLSMHNLN